jgi:hypothetical protein
MAVAPVVVAIGLATGKADTDADGDANLPEADGVLVPETTDDEAETLLEPSTSAAVAIRPPIKEVEEAANSALRDSNIGSLVKSISDKSEDQDLARFWLFKECTKDTRREGGISILVLIKTAAFIAGSRNLGTLATSSPNSSTLHLFDEFG